jgi:hypothetical protein
MDLQHQQQVHQLRPLLEATMFTSGQQAVQLLFKEKKWHTAMTLRKGYHLFYLTHQAVSATQQLVMPTI